MFIMKDTRSGLFALSLAFLLLSCGGSRHTVNPRTEELASFVLIVEEFNGQLSHSWQRATDFDLSRYAVCPHTGRAAGHIVFAAARPTDCDQEQIDCYRNCMTNRLPSSLNHIKRNDGGKSRYCSTACLEEYNRCLKLQGVDALEFSSASGAVEWLKRNRTEIILGSTIIIAGVVFVTISAGAGVVILAPIVLTAG